MNITREQLTAAVRALGLDPGRVIRIVADPAHVIVTQTRQSDDGKLIMDNGRVSLETNMLDVVP